MSTGRRSDERMSWGVFRAGRLPAACAVLMVGLAGCSHKQVRAHIPVASPVDLETLSMSEGDIEPIPDPELAPLQWPEPPKQPVRRRMPPREDATAPAPGVPETPAPAELAIGALTNGGDTTAEGQQQARDLIASVERNISALPIRVANAQKRQVRQVRNFLDQAKKALNTGDTDGATNLASKAKVMIDELEKR